jgi:hypothetical protein
MIPDRPAHSPSAEAAEAVPRALLSAGIFRIGGVVVPLNLRSMAATSAWSNDDGPEAS